MGSPSGPKKGELFPSLEKKITRSEKYLTRLCSDLEQRSWNFSQIRIFLLYLSLYNTTKLFQQFNLMFL